MSHSLAIEASVELSLASIAERLRGRVREAYVFGSAGTSTMTADSDIDLILVVDAVGAESFWLRPLPFRDLCDVFMPLDILVYTPNELKNQLADSGIGFWKSVRESMRRIV